MARITVEDCLLHVENRFSLVLIAAERTKQLMHGATPKLDASVDNKEVVTALREIAEGLIRYGEKDPEEVSPEVATAEVKRAVALKQLRQQHEIESASATTPPSQLPPLEDGEEEESGEFEDDLDQVTEDFPDSLDE